MWSITQEIRLVPPSSLAPGWPVQAGERVPAALGELWDSHADPLLQRVLQVLLADGVCEGPQSGLERDDGRGQVSEPAAALHLSLQDTGALP